MNNPIAPDKLYRTSLHALRSRDVEIDCSGIQENDSCMVAVLVSLQKESANFSGSLKTSSMAGSKRKGVGVSVKDRKKYFMQGWF